jgi:hypothetical protein
MALKGRVGQPAKGTLGFTETACVHFLTKNRLNLGYVKPFTGPLRLPGRRRGWELK